MKNDPSRRYEAVLIAASAGGAQALQTLLAGLPPDFPLPIAIVQQRTAREPHALAQVLGRCSALRVQMAQEGEVMRPGTVYLAPPDLLRHVRSSANPLFACAALALQGRVIAVVLTGYDSDGTDGVQTVGRAGGMVIARGEARSEQFSMPRAAIRSGSVNQVLPLGRIGADLLHLARPAP